MPLEIKDLVGLSQPLTKLIEVLASGMGVLYKPIGIRREASAQANALLQIGNAQLQVDAVRLQTMGAAEVAHTVIVAEASLQIQERSKARLDYRELRRQENLEAIADAAATHLPEQVSDTPIDEDWKTRFFNIAEDVSNSDMQDLWGKILAGEVARPGSYSVLTLEALKNLSKSDAESFQRLRYISLGSGQILKPGREIDLERFGVSFHDILNLREAALILDGDMLSVRFDFPEEGSLVLDYNGEGLLIEPSNETLKSVTFPVYILTRAGRQLLDLIEPRPNLEFLQLIAKEYSGSSSFYLGKPGLPREKFEKISPN